MINERRVVIPDGVQIQVDDKVLEVSGPKGTLRRNIWYPQIEIAIDGDEVIIRTESQRKRIAAMVGTFQSHTKNMCKGVSEGFEYRMKVVYSHFPIQLKLHPDRLDINNFLGEKQSRTAKIREGVTVGLGNDELTITGIDKEAVGNTAANIELATKIRKRDPRVFQDGIYLTERV